MKAAIYCRVSTEGQEQDGILLVDPGVHGWELVVDHALDLVPGYRASLIPVTIENDHLFIAPLLIAARMDLYPP